MSRMFTENVCMDFDQLILDLVQLLRTLWLGAYRSAPDTPRNLAELFRGLVRGDV
jgi:hypothetical protein